MPMAMPSGTASRRFPTYGRVGGIRAWRRMYVGCAKASDIPGRGSAEGVGDVSGVTVGYRLRRFPTYGRIGGIRGRRRM
jgi:hypothetical protein